MNMKNNNSRISFSDVDEIRFIENNNNNNNNNNLPNFFPDYIDKSNHSLNGKSSKINDLNITVKPINRKQLALRPVQKSASKLVFKK